jgi:hypothetical protein
MGRRLVPLLLLAVLTVGAAAAAYGGGHGQKGFVSGTAGAATPATGGSPALLHQIEAATARAGTAEFTFTSTTDDAGAKATIPSRGFGEVNFTSGVSNVFSTLSIPEPALPGEPPSTVTQSEQRMSLPSGIFEIVEGSSPDNSSGWVTMRRVVKPDSSPIQALINGNPGTLGLALALATGAKFEGGLTMSGVRTRIYRLTTPTLSCTSTAGEKLAFDSVLTANVDSRERIRQINQDTFVRFSPVAGNAEAVIGLTSQLVVTAFGHPVAVAAPKAVQAGGGAEIGRFSGAQCADLNGIFSSALASAGTTGG